MHVIETDGPELRVRHVPPPTPGRGEVVIEVAAAGVLAGDLDGVAAGGGGGPVTLAAGSPERGVVAAAGVSVAGGRAAGTVIAGTEEIPVTGAPSPAAPFVPGSGVAGRITAVGEGVPGEWLGRRVLSEVDGGYADRVVARVPGLIGIPDEVHEHEAMALLHEGSIALAVFEAAAVEAGESVLVLPASDAVGSLLVQLALDAGARVVGAARGPGRMQLVRDLGAELVVDHGEPGWPEQVGSVDVLFEGEPSTFDGAGRRFSVQGRHGDRPRVERILRAAAEGRVTPLIGQTYPLVRAAEAHAALAARRSVGKTLLIP